MRQDILEAGSQWMAKQRATEDPKILAQIVGRSEELLEQRGGYVSPSHFERAYLSLVSERAITPFKGSMETKIAKSAGPSIPQDVVAYIERTPVRDLRQRYNTDKVFRAQNDEYARANASQPQASNIPTTAAEYHQIPARSLPPVTSGSRSSARRSTSSLRRPKYECRTMPSLRCVTRVSGLDPDLAGAGDGNRTHVRSLGTIDSRVRNHFYG
jgi:hypothetical protein